ncbi:hypothetical protein FSP39_006553 [Pinctada imbricata]|uniref:glutathione transferase n=1 Tax=Pinctada imbricata TaxID=66713 RepID=A0AA88Y7J5_PINIB|nr:hypothetical protein FSP39_006553 [Pinctada imbricata]
MPFYKLTYFNIRGRAELTRLTFAAAEAEYEDDRIKRDDWPAMKENTPQGQLPTLTVDGVVLPQSLAIARFVAREFGLDGKTNIEKAQTDVVIQTTEDLRSGWVGVFREKDETRKAELEKAFHEETVPKFLKLFEGILKTNGTGYFVGNTLTIADLAVYDVFEILIQKKEDILSEFPLLAKSRKTVESAPGVQKYLSERPKTDF